MNVGLCRWGQTKCTHNYLMNKTNQKQVTFMVKGCCVGQALFWAYTWRVFRSTGVCFSAALPYLLLYSRLFKSKMSVIDMLRTHTGAQRVESYSVSDFQLIHKHKRPLCLASTMPPLLIHSSAEFLSCQPSKISPSRLLHNYTPVPLQIVPKYTKPTDCSEVL